MEHGERYRVAYCMHAGDFPIPTGWTVETMGFSAGTATRQKKEDGGGLRNVLAGLRAGCGGPATGVRMVSERLIHSR